MPINWLKSERSVGDRDESPADTTECVQCGSCDWIFTTDSANGSSVLECKKCRFWVYLNRGGLDRAQGMLLKRKGTLGSWGTFSLTSSHVSHLNSYG